MPTSPAARSAVDTQTTKPPGTQAPQTAARAVPAPQPSASAPPQNKSQPSQQQTPQLRWSLPPAHRLSLPAPTPDSDIFDPRLRHALQRVRDQPQRLKQTTDVIQRRPLLGANRSFVRVGDYCFVYEEANALNEDDFQRWSPVDC